MNTQFDELQSVAGPVSRETFEELRHFEAEFRRWSSRINLSAPSTLPSLWNRHILDSAQLIPLSKDATAWLDLGSGGGFPGAVIAILLKGKAGASITLVESNRKKAAFLSSVLGNLKAPANVLAIRIEEAWQRGLEPEIITARALAPLPELLALTSPWLGAGSRALFHKGRDYRAEVANSAAAWRFNLVEHRSAVEAESAILEISNLRATARPAG